MNWPPFFILKHCNIRIIIYSIGSLLEMTSLRDTESNENPDTRNGLSILPSITTSSPSEATGEILSTSSETPTSDQIEFYIDFSTIFPSDTLKEYVYFVVWQNETSPYRPGYLDRIVRYNETILILSIVGLVYASFSKQEPSSWCHLHCIWQCRCY